MTRRVGTSFKFLVGCVWMLERKMATANHTDPPIHPSDSTSLLQSQHVVQPQHPIYMGAAVNDEP